MLLFPFLELSFLYFGIIGVIVARKGYKPAKMFAMANFLFVLGGILIVLREIGVITSNTGGDWAGIIEVFVEMTLISFALSKRIEMISEEKQKIQKEFIELQKDTQAMLENEVVKKTQKLTLALDERELLLKELHHRVKNNLQIMMSLLRIQSRKIKDTLAQNTFKESINRINSMSKIHELLYNQNDILHLNTKEYLKELVDDLQQSFRDKKDVLIKMDVQIDLPFKQASYVGMIVNELVTNAFKYAFDKEGEIEIKLKVKGTRSFLEVSDNGKGFNEDVHIGFGLELVDTLVSTQLQGTIEKSSSNKGTYYKVEF